VREVEGAIRAAGRRPVILRAASEDEFDKVFAELQQEGAGALIVTADNTFTRNAPTSEATLRDLPEAARAMGLQIHVLKASTSGEIDAAFAAMVREHVDALFVAPDGFFDSRRVQLTILAARYAIPAAHAGRNGAEAGGLMSYGTLLAEMFRQAGVNTGQILKGAKPADLPVIQLTKFELVINLQTAKTLGLDVPPALLARADEVIE